MLRRLLSSQTTIFIGITIFLSPAFASADVFISEFSIGGGAGHTDDDFIELYNSGSKRVSLEHWKLRRRTKSGSESSVRELGKEDCIAPAGYFLWASSKAKSEYADHADTTSSATLTADNSLALFDADGTLEDAVTFGSGHTHPFPSPSALSNPGNALSHARDTLSLLWTENVSPTPTRSASDACATEPLPPDTTPPSGQGHVRINEIFPNPSTPQDRGEYIELYNESDSIVDISRWSVTDATKTGRYVFPSGTALQPHGYIVITDTDFSFSLNNTSETVSLFDASSVLQDTVSYSKTTEDASLNWTADGWRGSKTRTPGQPNILSNTLPSTKERVPKKGYRDVYLDFQVNGKDADGDKLKYVWNFGDGHKSYKGTTRHRYTETGSYLVSLTTKDGSEETIETFTIEIREFDPPKLRITAFMPNPAGRDTDSEWIEIRNLSKKKVDLQGYSIATGTKKLVNHPIRDSFIIAKKSSAKIGRTVSLFTLPNEKGKIELRAPDGKPIHSLKYKFSKSLPDNAILKKEKGKRLLLVLQPDTPDKSLKTSLPEESTPDMPDLEHSADESSQDTDREMFTRNIGRLHQEAHREHQARLLALTAHGTSIVFPDHIIDDIASVQERQSFSDLAPAATRIDTVTILEDFSSRANTWINSWSTDPDPLPLPELLPSEPQPDQMSHDAE